MIRLTFSVAALLVASPAAAQSALTAHEQGAVRLCLAAEFAGRPLCERALQLVGDRVHTDTRAALIAARDAGRPLSDVPLDPGQSYRVTARVGGEAVRGRVWVSADGRRSRVTVR